MSSAKYLHQEGKDSTRQPLKAPNHKRVEITFKKEGWHASR
jgi:hypothetical protein